MTSPIMLSGAMAVPLQCPLGSTEPDKLFGVGWSDFGEKAELLLAYADRVLVYLLLLCGQRFRRYPDILD